MRRFTPRVPASLDAIRIPLRHQTLAPGQVRLHSSLASARSTLLCRSFPRRSSPLSFQQRHFATSPRAYLNMAEHSPLASRTAMPTLIADKLQKPELDSRTYRVIELPNKLEAVLIHDPETDKASAAMDVNVGSFSDNDDLPGIAHAIEHLLFMGTKKFPGENDYNQYLQKFGGYSNAFTASTDTNYFFELSAKSTSSSDTDTANGTVDKASAPLYGALDRFSQFFVHPLFLEDTVDRELKAVDSENKKNLQSDTWRLHQLSKSLANPQHPYHKFSTGNFKVLHDDPVARGVEIRQEFIDFYKREYSANRMKLAVLGRESLDELEAWVVEFFSDVPNQNLAQHRWDAPAYSANEIGNITFAKPIKDSRQLEIIFNYPDEEPLWESSPGNYISHLIGHEGPGSILAYLKAKGWANSLSAGPRSVNPGTGLLSIYLDLTPEGLKQYQEIIKVVFQYITIIKAQPPQQWIVDEIKQVAEIEFRFRQQIPASRTTSHLSGVMQKPLPRDKLLSAQSLIWKFDPQAIQAGLDHLRPDNVRFTVISQDFPGNWDQKEKWYGTEYKLEKAPSEFMDELHKITKQSAAERPKELHLPHKNEFIPTKLDVEKKQADKPLLTPKLVRNDPRVRTWWKKDDQFWAPKANVMVLLRSPAIYASALTVTLARLVKELVEDSLVEYAYDAEIAGLDYGISTHSTDIDISVGGYNDKLHVLLQKVLKAFVELEVKEDRFEIIKDRLARSMRNAEYDDPFRQIGSYGRWLVSSHGYINPQLLDELPTITVEDVRRFLPQLVAQLHIEVLAHGNLYREDALRLTDIVEQALHKSRALPSSQWAVRRSLLLPAGSSHVYKRQIKDPENVNHCIDYIMYTHTATDYVTRAQLLLFSQMIEEPAFNTLRTKEQLGYVVFSGQVAEPGVSGFRILIQSERDPDYLESRIDAFLAEYKTRLNDITEEDFASFKIALINKRLEKLKNLGQESGRFWLHICSERFDFELVYRDVEEIKKLTKADLKSFFTKYIDPSSTQRKKLVVQLIAQTLAKGSEEKPDAITAAADAVVGVAESVKADLQAVMAPTDEEKKSFGADLNDVADATKADGEKKTEAVLIEDVRRFKASFPFSAGAVPVREVAEFEDLESKL